MTNMKKFDALFVFLEEYRKMDYDEKIFCQKVLVSFNTSIPIVITKEDVLGPEPFIPKEEQLPKESINIKSGIPGKGIQSQCDECGKSFVKNNNRQMYCSHACAIRSSKRKNGKFTKTCLVCGKIYKTDLKTSKYTANKGENHWKNRGKKGDSIIVNKKDDPFFKPKFIFGD